MLVQKRIQALSIRGAVVLLRRLDTNGKMEILRLRDLKPTSQRFTLGAVSGSTLYLTSLENPEYGIILSVDLDRDAEPEVSPVSGRCQS